MTLFDQVVLLIQFYIKSEFLLYEDILKQIAGE